VYLGASIDQFLEVTMTRAFLPFLLCLASNARGFSVLHSLRLPGIRFLQTSFTSLPAKPTGGSVVDSYQTVSVNCSSCSERLFRYKKKNGTKSNLVKCYVERIVDDCAGILACAPPNPQQTTTGNVRLVTLSLPGPQ
jgi:hypothetical protein